MFKMFLHNTFCLFVFFIFIFFCDAIFENFEKLFKNIGVRKVVYPKVLTYKETVSRFKRWTKKDKIVNRESLYIAVNQWTIKTNYNDDLIISPNYVSQWVYSTNESKSTFHNKKKNLHKCLPLKGKIEGIDNSSVLLTLCDNEIFGLINVSRKSFFLQPTEIDKRHILYETIIPYKLTSIIDDNDLYTKKWMGNEDNLDPLKSNIINDNENKNDDKEDRCVALVIGKDETKYVPVQSSLCPKNYLKKNYENNTVTRVNHKRDRRNPVQFRNVYSYYVTERPYREFRDCFEQSRNKRALSICDTAEYYNLTQDTAAPDYIQFIDASHNTQSDYNMEVDADINSDNYDNPQRIENALEDLDISARQMPHFRPPPSRVNYRWAKMVVGVDYDVIKFHGHRTEHYVYTVFNIVSSLFKEISSTDILRIVIMKMVLYEDPRDSAIYSGNMRYPLYSVNKWNRDMWRSVDEKYDMAVWYTHFHASDEISTSPGPYMCRWQWSCLLIEDVGWLSAIKIAHGIGHLIGLTHDGDLSVNNHCALDSLLQTTIMAAIIPAVMPTPVWSTCSKSEYIHSVKKYSCLDKPPLNFEHTEFLYGVFSLDDQCRIEFGDGWVYCSRISVHDPCKELWCNKNMGKRRSCMTRQTRTLEGTLCSRGKRCINQTCEDAQRPDYNADSTTSQRPQLQGSLDFKNTTLDLSSYPEMTTYRPSTYPIYTMTPSLRPPYYPGTSTYRPNGHPGTSTYRPPDSSGTSTYRPNGYPGTSTYRPPDYPGTSTYRPNGYPGTSTYRPPDYPGTSTHRPNGYPGTSTYRPPDYPGTSTHRPNGYPGTSTYRPSDYPGTSTYRPNGYPGTSTYRPPDYPGTSTYRPNGYPETSTYRPPDYPGTSTYRPNGYPGTSTYRPPDYSGTSTYRPNGYSETSTHRPNGYPGTSTYRPPDYPGTTTYRPTDYPGTSPYQPPGYPETSTYQPPGYPGTSTYQPPGYPGTSTYQPPGYPGSSTYQPPGYPGSSTYQPPGYPGSSTYQPPGYPGATAYPPSGITHRPDYSGTSTSVRPGYAGTNVSSPSGYPSIDTNVISHYPGSNNSTNYPSQPGYPGPGGNGPPAYPSSGSSGPPGHPGPNANGPPTHPGSGPSGPPSYSSPGGNGPPSYSGPGTNGPPSYPGSGASGPPSYPGTGANGQPNYPGSVNGPPGYPGSGANSPQNYPPQSLNRIPGYYSANAYPSGLTDSQEVNTITQSQIPAFPGQSAISDLFNTGRPSPASPSHIPETLLHPI